MNINRNRLKEATEQNLLSQEQADTLWAFLNEQQKDSPSFTFTHMLYYFGGMIAIGAMSLFMTLGWQEFGGWGIFFIALAYMFFGVLVTEYLLHTKKLPIPAGIMATFVVVLIPLAVFGLQMAYGWWGEQDDYRDYHRYIDMRWLLMELATLAGGAVMLWRYRLPFLVMPVAVTLWYMSMDLVPFLFGAEDLEWRLRKMVSVFVGLLITLLAFWVDVRTKDEKDYAFWFYLFGVITFWGGLSTMNSDSELNKFIYACINLALVVIGAILSRKVFAVVGGLGIVGYLGHLSYEIFEDSMLFPFVLTLFGFGVIYIGVIWQKHEASIAMTLRALLPAGVRAMIERRG